MTISVARFRAHLNDVDDFAIVRLERGLLEVAVDDANCALRVAENQVAAPARTACRRPAFEQRQRLACDHERDSRQSVSAADLWRHRPHSCHHRGLR